MAAKIKINILLSLPRSDFLAHIGGIYEKTPWVVEQFYTDNLSLALDPAVVAANKDRISNVKILFDEIKNYVKEGGREMQLELLKSHPDLCLKLDPPSSSSSEISADNAAADKPATDITQESRQEQGRAGLSTLTTEERTKFRALNNKYKENFQFPFILAVRNASKYTVLSALEGRVHSSIEDEIACALSQVDKIAWMRLLTKVDYAEGSNGHGGFLTCHVLDTANGSPASGMRIELYRYEDEPESNGFRIQQRILLKSFVTNSDGRLNGGPALSGTEFCEGQYEWVFYVGDYFAKYSLSRISGTPFLDVVPLRFGLDDPTEHYHVPLLASPWSYSTYRGS